MNDSFLSLLGLMRRAGKLELGFDAAKESLSKGKSRLLITSSDISPKSAKELAFFAGSAGNIPAVHTGYTGLDFEKALGRRVKILSVTDEGFAARALQLLNTKQSGEELY